MNVLDAYRLGQLRIAATVTRQLLRVWRRFDPDHIAASWDAIEGDIFSLTQSGFDASAALGGRFYQAQRGAAARGGYAHLELPRTPTEAELTHRLGLAGPRRAGALVRRNRPQVKSQTFVSLSGSVQRNVAAGGRTTIFNAVEHDTEAVGWVRVTSASPCAFCAMLSSRGPAYKSENSGRFRQDGALYHPHCGCQIVPQFSYDQPWPGRAAEFRAMWYEAGGDQAEFRRIIEGRAATYTEGVTTPDTGTG